jgi:hypothetical protein
MTSESEPQWETIDNGWHAVASLSKGYQWTAYIEYIDSPYWRIWAGCMFDSLKLAQEWCRAEIAHQVQRFQSEHLESAAVSKPEPEPDPWTWLWQTLTTELGEDHVDDLRNEMNRRLLEEQSKIS